MELKVILDPQTYREFTVFNVLKRLKYWKSPVTFASILMVCAIICFLMHKVDGAVLLGVVLLVVGLGMPMVYFISFFLNLKTEVDRQHLEGGRYVYTVALQNDVIHVENGKEKADYHYKDVYRAYRSYDCIYLFITQSRAFLLPSPEESQNALWTILKRKLGKERTELLDSKKTNQRVPYGESAEE